MFLSSRFLKLGYELQQWMVMRKIIVTFFSILVLGTTAFSQSGFDNEELLGIVYNKEFTFDFRFHTNGIFSFAYNRAKIKSYYKTNFFQVEVGTLKHPKESKNNNRIISFQNNPGGSYSFGKQNSLFLARGGYGQKRYFSEKQNRKGVAIGISYMGGVTLGVLKPYYLDLKVNQDGNPIFVRTPYTEEYADEFLDVFSIINSSGFKYGWNDLSFVPGGHAKIGVHLDWGAYDEFVKGLEFGFMLDVFYKKVPIMIGEDNKMAFLNVYLSIQLGKRSN